MFTREILGEALGVSISDYRCRAHRQPDGPEEANESHSIVFVRRGVFRRKDGDGTLTADANRVVFFNPQRPYRVFHPISGGDDCTVFTLSEARVRELVALRDPLEADAPRVSFPRTHGLTTTRTARRHLEVFVRVRRGESSLALEDAVAELLRETLHAAADDPVSTRHRDAAEAASLAIAARAARPPSLVRLARELGYSPFHLSHIFKRVNGVSLRAYHSRLRARLAAERILEGASDLTRLALDLGYADHSHLSSSFRRAWGISPSAFRSSVRPAARKIVQAAQPPNRSDSGHDHEQHPVH